MKDSILENESDETTEIQHDLLRANANILKDNYEFKNKIIYLYDAGVLTEISKTAIVTDNLILINVAFFKENAIAKNKYIYKEDGDGYTKQKSDSDSMSLLLELAKGTFTDCIKVPLAELVKVLNDDGYTNSAQIIKQMLEEKKDYYHFPKKDMEYFEEFSKTKFPTIIHEFIKTKDESKIVDFVKQEKESINNLNNIAYALVLNQFSSYNMKNQFDIVLTSNVNVAISKELSKSDNFDNVRRQILIDEISGFNDIRIGLSEKVIKPKMK